MDAGLITKPFRLDRIAAASAAEIAELRTLATKIHASAGTGLKFSLDRNYVLTLEFGVPFDKDDGRPALYFASDFIF